MRLGDVAQDLTKKVYTFEEKIAEDWKKII